MLSKTISLGEFSSAVWNRAVVPGVDFVLIVDMLHVGIQIIFGGKAFSAVGTLITLFYASVLYLVRALVFPEIAGRKERFSTLMTL